MKVLVVASDTKVSAFVQASIQLRWPDGVLITSETAENGLEALETQSPDLLVIHDHILDTPVNQFIRDIRLFSSVLIMVLGEDPDQMSVVTALTTGADDYVRLPCPMSELMARIWAAMRRGGAQMVSDGGGPLASGELLINPSTYEVYLGKRSVPLTVTEFRLLYILAKSVPAIVSHETLEQALWSDRDDIGIQRLVKKYVQRLRRKLEDSSSEPRWIANVHGMGYRFIGPRLETPFAQANGADSP